MAKSKNWTEKSDDAFDRKNGIKDGTKKDRKLDKARGLPADKPAKPRKRK